MSTRKTAHSTSIKGKTIFVGLSGGVDSAVTAALLKEGGAHVVGVFIKGWYPPGMPCTWSADRRDAMRVAAHLGIPFHTLDASAEYKAGVIDYLLAEYGAGRTPNPDVMCNREVKFGAFYRFAKEHDADFIATGHYAQSTHAGTATLLRGIDEAKDQSYFLWAIPQTALEYSLFPLGGMVKADTRKLAQKFGLPVADKRDSQGICFLGSISVEDFLRAEFGTRPGEALGIDGLKIGQHDGALLYTIGERVVLTDAATGPWYVVRKDIKSNVLVVSHSSTQETISNRATPVAFTQSNWLIEHVPAAVTAQYRYHGPKIAGTLSVTSQTFTPNSSLAEVPASGQSLVFYVGEQCIGGGIIS